MQGPLKGTIVLGLTEYGAGPFATFLLSGLGARVIKIESPKRGGDSARAVPPLVVDDDSPFFQPMNLGSESVCLDISAADGRAAFERLVAKADALLTNFRPHAVSNLGLTYESLSRINPRLVVCTLTGYGRKGPLADAPGYDYLFQARYGNMALTGGPDEPPTRSGSPYVDMMGAALAALGVTAALHVARKTGQGSHVDTSLMEAAVWCLGYLPSWISCAGYRPRRMPWGSHGSVVPSRVFPTADGHIMLMCQTEAFWRKLCVCVGRPDLLERREFSTLSDRNENRTLLDPILEELFLGQKTEYWLDVLGNEVPVAPVNSLEQALADPHLAESGLLQHVEHPVFQNLRCVMPPFTLDGERFVLGRAPRLGEHTRSVLQELASLSDAEIDSLLDSGVALAK